VNCTKISHRSLLMHYTFMTSVKAVRIMAHKQTTNTIVKISVIVNNGSNSSSS